tara:strand:+ start:2832 stop:3182 length:351 start_codon:yes stop_codon:yes gene_type:complete
MELKDKALKDFWIWYLLPEQRKTYKTDSLIGKDPAIKIRFLAMSFAERFGVYVDFFDSAGYDISTEIDFFCIFSNKYIKYAGEDVVEGLVWEEDTLSRQESRSKAIEKVNEIHNKK